MDHPEAIRKNDFLSKEMGTKILYLNIRAAASIILVVSFSMLVHDAVVIVAGCFCSSIHGDCKKQFCKYSYVHLVLGASVM